MISCGRLRRGRRRPISAHRSRDEGPVSDWRGPLEYRASAVLCRRERRGGAEYLSSHQHIFAIVVSLAQSARSTSCFSVIAFSHLVRLAARRAACRRPRRRARPTLKRGGWCCIASVPTVPPLIDIARRYRIPYAEYCAVLLPSSPISAYAALPLTRRRKLRATLYGHPGKGYLLSGDNSADNRRHQAASMPIFEASCVDAAGPSRDGHDINRMRLSSNSAAALRRHRNSASSASILVITTARHGRSIDVGE